MGLESSEKAGETTSHETKSSLFDRVMDRITSTPSTDANCKVPPLKKAEEYATLIGGGLVSGPALGFAGAGVFCVATGVMDSVACAASPQFVFGAGVVIGTVATPIAGGLQAHDNIKRAEDKCRNDKLLKK